MDDRRWESYAQDKNLPLPNIRNSTQINNNNNNKQSYEEQKFTYKTNASCRSPGDQLSTIKDEKSNLNLTDTANAIEEHPES